MHKNSFNKKDAIAGYLFILPNLVGFLVFTLISVVFSLTISFTNWDMMSSLSEVKFTGLQNYIRLFSDSWFLDSLLNNLYFMLFVPVYLFIALVAAVIFNGLIFFSKLFRTVIFLPNLTNIVITAFLWQMLLRPNGGIINNILMSLGIANPPGWLASTFWVKPALVVMLGWMGIGYYAVIYLSGLQAIPKQLYEAASIDGAGKVKQFFRITIPMISPTTFLQMITGIIGSFGIWSIIQVLTGGGPRTSSSVIGFYIYKSAFEFGEMGYASAMAWVLFIIVLLLTLVQWRGQKKWVNYM
jgi:multiple sugar transport system permease protein